MKQIVNLLVVLFLFAITTSAQTYQAIPSKSVLKWNGKKVTGEHYGKIGLKEGSFTIENNKVTEGRFVIDMTSMTNEDLEGEWNEKLIGHLKSDDFFGVETYPEALLVIKESSKLVNNKAKIKGDLTVKGITHPIEFEATQSGNTFKAEVTVDRTLYNVRYGSGKFFDNLGDKTIYYNFTLNVEIVANSEMTSR